MRGERTVIIRSPTSFLAETREKSRRNFGRGRGKKKKQEKRKEKGDEEAHFIDRIRRERGERTCGLSSWGSAVYRAVSTEGH